MANVCVLVNSLPQCWGSDFTKVPANIVGIQMLKIVAGQRHLWLSKAHEIYCWGSSLVASGPTKTHRSEGHHSWRSTAFLIHMLCYCGFQFNVTCWGFNDYGSLNVPAGLSPATAIQSNGPETCALKGSQLKCWSDGNLADIAAKKISGKIFLILLSVLSPFAPLPWSKNRLLGYQYMQTQMSTFKMPELGDLTSLSVYHHDSLWNVHERERLLASWFAKSMEWRTRNGARFISSLSSISQSSGGVACGSITLVPPTVGAARTRVLMRAFLVALRPSDSIA